MPSTLARRGKQRLARFDEYISGKSNEDAEAALKTFLATAKQFTQFSCNSPEALKGFVDGSLARKALADRVGTFFENSDCPQHQSVGCHRKSR